MVNKKYGYDCFINRELSWLEFNKRVLEECIDESNPLFERLKFAAITSSNLDEFFMVRVGSLGDQIDAGFDKVDPSGLSPKEQLGLISQKAHMLVDKQYEILNGVLLKKLSENGINFTQMSGLTAEQKDFVDKYYINNVFPVLTPMVVDQSRPFPLLLNKSLNIALLIENNEDAEPVFGMVQVPAVLSRVIEIPGEGGKIYIHLEDIIKEHIQSIFIGHDIITMSCFRITRNGDLDYDEEEAEDLLEEIRQSVRKRRWGAVVRLEIEKDMDDRLLSMLCDELEVEEHEIFRIEGPIDLTYLMKLTSEKGHDQLRYAPLIQQYPEIFERQGIFEAISMKDIILHCPYQSFDPVIQFVKTAASDPNVLAIKQTLYRVSGDSPIIKALEKAAENGKQVTVLVELKARFDEENNIQWAERLEKAGCHVIYGLLGLKTHCKILLVVRKEHEGIKRYVHLSTGNYNDVTAKIYTDLSLFSSNPYLGSDASSVFNMLSGYSRLDNLYKIAVAPLSLRQKFLQLIRNETQIALDGKEGHIVAKMNSLVDEEIIEALYDASKAGVKIELIVRGICCLKPGIKDLSENITVRSIVGRFLEHSRIYFFYDNGGEKIFLSSADWMNRNLDRRVEILFPVEDKKIKDHIKKILDITLQDNVKARLMKHDGSYERPSYREGCNSQEIFLSLYKNK